MIVPCPENLKEYQRFPLTVTLALLNVFIFVLIFNGASPSLDNNKVLQYEGMQLTGRLYYQYLQSLSPQELQERPEWVHRLRSADADQMGVLGGYALRDASFLEVASAQTYKGDAVQIDAWKENIETFRKEYRSQLLFRFGLSSLEKGPLSWVTYQFSHSTWMHLLSNLMFLVVIGVAVEALAGSGVLLIVYLVGGLAGGLGFLLSQGHGTVPMVGASASISALLAFYCVAQTKARIRYVYFISPIEGQYGFIFLPTLMILPLFLVVDLANLWATPEGLGSGVAYAAHLGGSVFGLLGGLAYRYGARSRSRTLTET
ncbi:MAG: rhomboid family intramembrane serine protease [Bdellovibrio sp.]|nr:rhomboid family intramembrane serine protease [Bdellovibrio sp.]